MKAHKLEKEVETLKNEMAEKERKQAGQTDFLLNEMKRQREEIDVLKAEKEDALLEIENIKTVSNDQMVKQNF